MSVFWAGKPHANAYEAARAAAEAVRGAPVPLDRIIAIGDSLRTDLKGAEAAGIAAIFVASGIHRDETMGAGVAVGGEARAAVCPAGAPGHRRDGTPRLVARAQRCGSLRAQRLDLRRGQGWGRRSCAALLLQ